MTAVQAPPLHSQQMANKDLLGRKASFTDVEKCCLRALLLDTTTIRDPSQQSKLQPNPRSKPENPTTVFDDTVLFQLPFEGADATGIRSNNNNNNNDNKFGRHEKKILGLWQAHKDGVHSVIMHKRAPSGAMTPSIPSSTHLKTHKSSRSFDVSTDDSAGYLTVPSDIEVRPLQDHDDGSSWGEEDGGFLHYDAWEVLKDEYAEDYGFNYNETMSTIAATLSGQDQANQSHVFRILGTSADDQSAQPHVLSPPLMDSLLQFVPDSISMENYWLKFSMIRDGASLYTLKQYVKASPNTILAIETTKGDVFGAFTSNIWRNHQTFYGNAPAFLWRMRHNRRTPCHSLFDQAQMESEIDTYPFSGWNDLVQVCDNDRLAVGGGKLVPDWELNTLGEKGETSGGDGDSFDQGQSFGFGICVEEDLLEGTTSPCGTFRNPCLTNDTSKGEVFQIANLEVWTFTPCMDVKAAQKVELTRHVLEESIRSVDSSNSSLGRANQEEFRRDFYRRVGHDMPTRRQRKGSYGHIDAPFTYS